MTALIGLAIVSCDSSSDNPTGPSIPPTTVVVQRVDVSAPESIAPGESAQLTATAVRSDGSTENVTGTAAWLSSNTRAVTVAAGGRATAISSGEAVISARFQNRVGSRPVIAVPTGTFKVSGRVTEGPSPVPDVALRVTRGVGDGLTATSNFDGRFVFYGVAGDVRIQASKEGYIDAVRDLTVASTTTENFEIVPARPRKNLAGSYSLSFTVGPCSGTSTFPSDLRTRTYAATITQSGQALTVNLDGATFIVTADHGDKFSGSIDPADNVTFSIGDPYYYYYLTAESFDIVERVDEVRSFSVVGFVTARVSGSEITGALSGSFVVMSPGTRTPFALQSTCFSPTHTFVMRAR